MTTKVPERKKTSNLLQKFFHRNYSSSSMSKFSASSSRLDLRARDFANEKDGRDETRRDEISAKRKLLLLKMTTARSSR